MNSNNFEHYFSMITGYEPKEWQLKLFQDILSDVHHCKIVYPARSVGYSSFITALALYLADKYESSKIYIQDNIRLKGIACKKNNLYVFKTEHDLVGKQADFVLFDRPCNNGEQFRPYIAIVVSDDNHTINFVMSKFVLFPEYDRRKSHKMLASQQSYYLDKYILDTKAVKITKGLNTIL